MHLSVNYLLIKQPFSGKNVHKNKEFDTFDSKKIV